MIKNIRLVTIGCFCAMLSSCEPGQRGYGWPTVKCWKDGSLAYSANNVKCPDYAGKGYAQLETGSVIEAECVCSMP